MDTLPVRILLPFFFSILVTFILTPVVISFAKKKGLVDDPAKRPHPAHTHTGIIPRAGGLALFLGIGITSVIFLPINKILIGALISMTLLTAVGLQDDKADVSPYVRLGTNALAALIVVMAGAGIPFITNPITGGIINLSAWRITFEFFGSHSILVWADLLAFVWIMWTMNIVGWSAGVDGQMPGFVAISAAVLALLSLRYSIIEPTQLFVTVLACIVSGAFAGFIPWNFYPQKIMPGYSGKTLAGFLLALLGIFSYGKLGTAILVLGIPTVDAIYTLIRRISKGKSPVWGDSKHLHHHLLSLGWGRRRIALFYWGVSAILGAVALNLKSQQKVFALFVIAIAIGGFFLWVNYFSQFSKSQDRDNG